MNEIDRVVYHVPHLTKKTTCVITRISSWWFSAVQSEETTRDEDYMCKAKDLKVDVRINASDSFFHLKRAGINMSFEIMNPLVAMDEVLSCLLGHRNR